MTAIHLGYSAHKSRAGAKSTQVTPAARPAVSDEPLSIDELINASLQLCSDLPRSCHPFVKQIRELHSRLARGRIQLAVLGQYNRGKSTFINAITGLQVLPTSILPVTAVPTMLSYGPTTSCTVHFFNGKGDLVVRESPERVSATLLHYVAEQNNPRNHLCVSHVDVTTPSELLENGTVLIDTPGFGSTYVHNTKTTLDLLSDCDAALFMLGADPPTQTELEFLKQITPRIRRIFFILNKTDQLSQSEVGAVDSFLRSILANELHTEIRSDPIILHISAAAALKAKTRDESDPEWKSSGLEAVRREILEFLVRDKYFALSEALSSKLKSGIGNIISELSREVSEAKAPLSILEKEHAEVTAQLEKVRSETDAARASLKKIADDLGTLVSERLELKKDQISRETTEAFEALLANSDGSSDVWSSVAAFVPALLNEILGARASSIREHASQKLLRARFDLFVGLDELGGTFGISRERSVAASDVVFPTWKATVSHIADDPGLSWSEKLLAKKKRVTVLRDRLLPTFQAILEENRCGLVSMLKKTIDDTTSAIGVEIDQFSAELTFYLKNLWDKKERSLRDQQDRNGPMVNGHEELIGQFTALKTRIIG